jgi:membrane-associated phospholipid phosphatase
MSLRTIDYRRFLTNRLDAKTYLGLHLTLSLMIAAGALWVFAATFDAVLDNATMVRVDMAAAAAIHQHTTAVGLRIFQGISSAGSPTTMSVISIIAGIVLFVHRHRTLIVTWVAAFCGGALLEHLLKSIVGRTRPMFGAAYLTDQSASFPSGHAMMATLGIGMLVYVLIVTRVVRGWMRVALVVVAFVCVVLVGLSRIYLGVHYPSDVLGGFTAGGAWLAVCVSVAGITLHHRGYALSS